MNFLKLFAFKIGKNYILKQLDHKDFRDKIIKAVNEKVNIPKLNESQERKLFQAIYDAIRTYLNGK